MRAASRGTTSSGARPRRCCATSTAFFPPDRPARSEGDSATSRNMSPATRSVSWIAMSFFAVLFALLLEQVKPLPRGNVIHDALTGWMRWTARNFDAGRESHAWVVWCVAVLAPALLVGAMFVWAERLQDVLGLVFDVAVLYLTLGFRQFSHYFTDIRDALERGNEFERVANIGEV